MAHKASLQEPRNVLFIGNSFTYSAYAPVSRYNASSVVDEHSAANRDMPRGGVPGIIAKFAAEQDLPMQIHMYAVGNAHLAQMQDAAIRLLATHSWDAVLLQEHSSVPLSRRANGTSCAPPGTSELSCTSQILAQAVVAHSLHARVYLVQTPVSPDRVVALHASEDELVRRSSHAYAVARNATHAISGVAPVGEGFLDAQRAGIATRSYPNDDLSQRPRLLRALLRRSKAFEAFYARYIDRSYAPSTETRREPPPARSADARVQLFAPDDHHCSTAGSYLAALIEYATLTHIDPRTLGNRERAARDLGISTAMTHDLQTVAAATAAADGVRLFRRPPEQRDD